MNGKTLRKLIKVYSSGNTEHPDYARAHELLADIIEMGDSDDNSRAGSKLVYTEPILLAYINARLGDG